MNPAATLAQLYLEFEEIDIGPFEVGLEAVVEVASVHENHDPFHFASRLENPPLPKQGRGCNRPTVAGAKVGSLYIYLIT
jgi:hypothetical protein